ncbi:MAG TPA: hypothetical protein VF245_08060 [Solirubrobacterales bacterium]
MNLSVGAIGVLAALVLAACGGSSAPSTDSASTNGSKSEATSANDKAAGMRASVLHFGNAGTKAEAATAATTLAAFFSDREDGYWPAACSYLSAGTRSRTQQVGGPGKCGKGIEALTIRASKAAGESKIVSVKALRRNGVEGFLIYTTEAGKTNAMRMVLEAGEWKLGGINPTPLIS